MNDDLHLRSIIIPRRICGSLGMMVKRHSPKDWVMGIVFKNALRAPTETKIHNRYPKTSN
jgi:hypothetical protein